MRRRDLSDEEKKLERLQGLKAIRDTWYQHSHSHFYDQEYVAGLEERIRQGETRIRNGL
jgi:hypothetical protein